MARAISVGVNTHGHCFDGLSSAVAFTHLLTRLSPGDGLTFSYRSCGYGPKMSAVPAEWLTSDLNAILDFRYTESDRLHYYFDHHATAFGSADEEARARAAVSRSSKGDARARRALYFDASYGSCTKLIVDTARAEHGLAFEELDELVAWADRIDAARFESAEQALGDAPAQRLAQVVEHHGDGDFLAKWVPELGRRTLEDVARCAEIDKLFAPLAAAKQAYTRRVKAKAIDRGDVVFVDLTDEPIAPAGKFVAYALFPRASYSVTLHRTKQLIKLSVGYNPWCGNARRHDIAALCRDEGGGGHPVVGAATFQPHERDRARAAAMRVVHALES